MIQTNELQLNKSNSYQLGVFANGRKSYHFGFAYAGPQVHLLLFQAMGTEPVADILLDEQYKEGDVFTVDIVGAELRNYLYLYECDHVRMTDPYATRLAGCGAFGIPSAVQYGVIGSAEFDWKGDEHPSIPANEMILYRLHVRNYTKSRSSGVTKKGTFAGLREKILYLQELGVNAVELMPAYEFEEVNEGGSLNCWGYSKGFYMAPKAAYCASYNGSAIKDYTTEVKEMVKAFHAAGMDVIMEFYFPSDITGGMVVDCIRHWRRVYHIDGVHLICDERIRMMLAQDPYLKDLKLLYTNWYQDINNHNLYEYHEGFSQVARRLLKGDEDQMQKFLDAFRHNPSHAANINFVTTNNGFTLMDLVSYDRKHNEENGEHNRDGADYNLSWNHGVEGPTKTRKIVALRNKSRKNAMAMLLLAQGVPMIYAGDEFGNSQNGNNNTYCQDNETGWVNWNNLKKDAVFFEFVKMLIAFRKTHKVLHMEEETFMTDYHYYGLPDISYHGSRAWYPDLVHYSRHAGVLLCGRYAEEEEDIYIGFNLHWEEHELALPTIAGKKWEFLFDTMEGWIPKLDEDKKFAIAPRSIVVLRSIK